MKLNKHRMKRNILSGLFLLFTHMVIAQTTYEVTLTTDPVTGPSSPGQLRWAIEQANLTPGISIITFNIPGSGPFVLTMQNSLPVIQDRTVYIDGTTQPGYNFNDPGNPLVIIDGQNYITAGISFTNANGSKLTGIGIKGFSTGLRLTTSNFCEITNNTINRCFGVVCVLHSSNFCTLKGNYLNTDKDLTQFTTQPEEGLYFYSSNDNIIGGLNCGEGNTIAYVRSEGIDNYSYPNPIGQRNRYTGNRIFENDSGWGADDEITIRTIGNGGKAYPTIATTGCTTSGTSQANNIIEIFGSSGPVNTRVNAKVFMGTTKANGIGQWSLPLSNIVYPYITAIATDSLNNSSELSPAKSIEKDSLNLSIKKPTKICNQEKVLFEIGGAKCLKALTFVWNYGDGTASTSSFEHTFNTAGTYTVTVSAYEQNNCLPITATATVTVEACSQYDCSPCSFSVTGTGLTYAGGAAVIPNTEDRAGLYKAIANASGGIEPYTFSWTRSAGTSFTPGNPPEPLVFSNVTSSQVIIFTSGGTPMPYTVTVKVMDASGCAVYKTFKYPN